MEDIAPQLQHKEDFQKAIQNYTLSAHAKKVLADSRLVVLLGVAGGGRNTLINYLAKTGPYHFIVSDTTRPPKVRDGYLEQNGVHYFFRTEDEFLTDLQSGEYIEAEIIHNQQVSGTSIRELQKATDRGLIGIHDFDVIGAANLQALKSDAYVIGLLPPSFEEWQKRLSTREQMHSKEFINRMRSATVILQDMLQKQYFKFLISDNVEHSSIRLRKIVEENIYSEEQHNEGLKIARSLLEQTIQLVERESM